MNNESYKDGTSGIRKGNIRNKIQLVGYMTEKERILRKGCECGNYCTNKNTNYDK